MTSASVASVKKGGRYGEASEPPRPFTLPKMAVQPMDLHISEKRYLVVIPELRKRLMVGEKLGQVLIALRSGHSIEDAALSLSDTWNTPVTADQVQAIVAEHLVPRGLAFPPGESARTPAAPDAPQRNPLYVRLFRGLSRWTLIDREQVGRISSTMTVLYEPLSIAMAVVLIASTRMMLYRGMTARYYMQWMSKLTPAEYLAGIGFVIGVVLIHEFGHASAQVLFGLKPGPIGFQLYFYIPALFADVSASWKLKPRQRVVVDVGGIYFQSIAASLLWVAYLGTHFGPLRTAVVASDTLCLISLNPFLKFDGYWMLTDALAVPNLTNLSKQVLIDRARRLFGRTAGQRPLPLDNARKLVLASYAVLKNGFWLGLVFLIARRGIALSTRAAGAISDFTLQAVRGLQALDPALLLASILRMVLLALLLLTTCCLIGNLLVAAGKLAVSLVQRVRPFRRPDGVDAGSRQGAPEAL